MDFVYCIRRWDESGFIKSGQNDRSRHMPWLAVPTKHDGKGFLRLAAKDPDGSVYGIWILILAVAGKCSARGVLADEDGPLTVTDIALKIRRTEAAVEKALEVLCSQDVKWIEKRPASDLLAIGPPTEQDRTERSSDSELRSEAEAGEIALAATPGKGRAGEESVFRKIDEAILHDVPKLRRWFEWQSTSPGGMSPICKNTSENWRNCLASAIHSRQRGRNPVALFRRIFGTQDFSKIPKKIWEKADKN